MATTPAVFHAYLRPATLQILRATGYHSTRPNVVDSLTDLAARYLAVLCEKTAAHATHNHVDGNSADFDVSDIRLAMQDMGALLPDKIGVEDRLAIGGEAEDVRGVEDFIAWFNGQRMKELMDVGTENGESDATDYLNALKKKHNKTGDDAKYNGTILGRPTQGSEVAVEGGPVASINEWITQRRNDSLLHDVAESPASSALSSVGDQLRDQDGDMDMA